MVRLTFRIYQVYLKVNLFQDSLNPYLKNDKIIFQHAVHFFYNTNCKLKLLNTHINKLCTYCNRYSEVPYKFQVLKFMFQTFTFKAHFKNKTLFFSLESHF